MKEDHEGVEGGGGRRRRKEEGVKIRKEVEDEGGTWRCGGRK